MATDRQTLKKQITDNFISNPDIIAAYGLTLGNTFEDEFSIVSIENHLFDQMAFQLNYHEKIVEANAKNSRPQNQQNFLETVMNFRDGMALIWKDGQFQYDLSSVENPEERKIIKRCAVLESDDGELVVKIATEAAGVLQPVTNDQEVRINQYLRQQKVPGVKIRLINSASDLLKTTLNVYVDPLIIDLQNGSLLNSETEVYPLKEAINEYLKNLRFNGAFVKDDLRTTIKNASGIDLVEIVSMQWKYAAFPFVDFGEWKVPEAGYFKINDEDLTINYLPNVLVNS